MNSQMGLGRRSLNGVDHWESNISADCFLHGTNILILPGDGTNGEYDANAICKIVERFLNNNFISGFDGHIFCAYYPDSANCGTHRLNQDAELGRLDDRLYPVAKNIMTITESFLTSGCYRLFQKTADRHGSIWKPRRRISAGCPLSAIVTADLFCLSWKTCFSRICSGSAIRKRSGDISRNSCLFST